MPAVRRIRNLRRGVLWGGQCPIRGCLHRFHLDAEPWMQKIHVLVEASQIRRDHHPHLHGEFVLCGYEERGGE